MGINKLVERLKEAGEDYEFYPTSQPMVDAVKRDMAHRDRYWGDKSILDIGCGNGNFFKKLFGSDNFTTGRVKCYGIEKSQILRSELSRNVAVIGCDFWNTTLYDKRVDMVFCNPPYSEYEGWVCRILENANADYIYFVIPSRWKENKTIRKILERYNIDVDIDVTDAQDEDEEDRLRGFRILYQGDFYDGERSANTTVDVVVFHRVGWSERNKFEEWFTLQFPEYNEPELKKDIEEEVHNELVAGRNIVDILVDLYCRDMQDLNESYRVLSKLRGSILEAIGVDKKSICESLRQKIESIKSQYWKRLLDNAKPITDRLTHEYRNRIFQKHESMLTVDFNPENIYQTILWIIRHIQDYIGLQLIDFYKNLSREENVKPYKSNQRTFKLERWRYASVEIDDNNKFVLDYRIVCSNFLFCNLWRENRRWDWDYCKNDTGVTDWIAICNNLNFKVSRVDWPSDYGKLGKLIGLNDETLAEFRCYRNGNLHLNLNIELCKAMNIEVGRLLGWIKSKEDIQNEFPEEFARGAEKYWNVSTLALCNSKVQLLGNGG